MAWKNWILCGAAIWVGLIAMVIGILTYGLPCTSSESLICKLHHFIGFYNLAWHLDKFNLMLTRSQALFSSKRGHVFSHHVLWMAPFLSGGGYCSEALSFVLGMAASGRVAHLTIEQHGDLANEAFWKGLPADVKYTLIKSYKPGHPLNDTIVICHSEPGAWYPSLFETHTCPPTGYAEPLFVVGRTMFETDRVSAEHVKRCNMMDEVWVPTTFNLKTFRDSGVDPTKLVKMVQSVDVRFFNPSAVKPIALPTAGQIFGPALGNGFKHLASDCFVFLSIFKWEYRKGWDLLMRAYLNEFSAQENVALFLLTNAYHTGRVYEVDILGYVKEVGIHEPTHGWPRVIVSDNHVPQLELPRLYKSADAFVLPSRGEGWGRPHVEAMSMALPVIATNWSGMTEYMTEENSYPLRVDGLVEVHEGPFKGHLWAEPSISHLRTLMRHVFDQPMEAKAKGLIARKTMVDQFSLEVVTKEVVQHLIRIRKKKTKQ